MHLYMQKLDRLCTACFERCQSDCLVNGVMCLDFVGAGSCFVCLASIVVRKLKLVTINAHHVACHFGSMP